MKFKTLAIHAGQGPEPLHGAVMTPVYQTSTFAFRDVDEPREFDYSRSGNPTRKALETCLATLEGGVRGLAFASGMAAETAVMLQFGAGDHVVLGDQVYGGTYRLMINVLRPRGMEVDLVDLNDLDAVRHAFRPNTRAIWMESPTNPLMKVVDLRAIASLAREHGVQSICDNTFLSPYFQNPLALGVDVVVHSTTKYLNGHSDTVGGAVIVADPALGERLYYLQNATGGVPGPWDCFLVLRGIKTLALRMEEHQKNGLQLARWLESHVKIERVLHPGLESHPQHKLQRTQARGDGSTFSFILQGGVKAAHQLLRGLRLFPQAVSLGGVESLIEYPWTMTHGTIPEEARRAMGLREGLLRVSVGLEDAEDLLEDFEQALART